MERTLDAWPAIACFLLMMCELRPAHAAASETELAHPRIRLEGRAIDGMGRGVSEVFVIATEKMGSRVVSAARSDSGGRFVLTVPDRPHEIGVLSPTWLISRVDAETAPVRLVLTPVFRGADPHVILARASRSVPVLVSPRSPPGKPGGRNGSTIRGLEIGVTEGFVVDETGRPLPGVILISVDGRAGRDEPLASTVTDLNGHYDLVTRAGPSRVYPLAAGLRLESASRDVDGRLRMVMIIDAPAETVVTTFRTGRSLKFNMNDSEWPPYLPPPEVRQVLRADYGIDLTSPNSCFCPGDLVRDGLKPWRRPCSRAARLACSSPARCPPSVWQRQCKVPKYWWLRLLDAAPPNPTKLDNGFGGDFTDRWWEEMVREMQLEEQRGRP